MPFIALVAAQVAPAATEVYPAAFFAAYTPQTALDMIQYLPGFRPNLGDEGVRGFAEAGGNVLIDGARPVNKSGGLSVALATIPARRVARIDILRSGASGETLDQTVVANVVLLPRQGGVATKARVALQGSGVFGEASVTVTRSHAGFDLTARTTFETSGQRSGGARSQFDSASRLGGRQVLALDGDQPRLAQHLALSGPLAGGKVQLAAALVRARQTEAFSFLDDGRAERFPKRMDRWRGELSGDWARTMGNGYTLKLLALGTLTDADTKSLSQVGATLSDLRTSSVFESLDLSRETIVRATLDRDETLGWRPKAGVEIAWNRLDNRSIATIHAAAPSRSETAVQVAETRADLFATLDWRPGPRWALTAGAAYELSRIRARGDGDRAGRYGFLKPRLMASYKPDDRSDLRLSVRRTVGQLSFGDFAASANPVEGKTYGGNAGLGPDHRVSLALDYDRRFARRGAFNLGLFHDWRGDVLEAAVLPSGASGVANVERARAWGASANLELPVDGVAPGGLVKLTYHYQRSRLVDPVTGQRRGLNGQRPQALTAAFRQDVNAASLSWGLDYTQGYSAWYWYVDEARHYRRAQELSAFVETTRFKAAKLRLQLDGLLGTRNVYDRAKYAATRDGAAVQREVWDIRTPVMISVSISRNF